MEEVFDAIAAAIVRAVNDRSGDSAVSEAERHGLIRQGDGTPSQITVWEMRKEDKTLWFQWRWYDPSQAFSIQRDINILSLELRQGDKVLRKAEQRYED
jgi:hypothetical protein